MQGVPYISDRIEVKQSSIHGYGVFARSGLDEGLVIERAYCLTLSTMFDKVDDVLKDYVVGVRDHGRYGKSSAVLLGFAMIYNYSDKPNVLYKKNKKTFSFYTTRYIDKGEELLINYGENSHSALRINNG